MVARIPCARCGSCEALQGGFASSRILSEHGQRMVQRQFEPGGPAKFQVKDLKNWRLSVSRAADVPAFVIFNDETLLDLIEVQPTNLDELLKIKGIGPVKAERYGKEILELVSRGR